MKKLSLGILALIAAIGLTACDIQWAGVYVSDGVYHHDHYYRSYDPFERSRRHRAERRADRAERENRYHRDRLERIERNTAAKQRSEGVPGLRPPGRKIRSMLMTMENSSVMPVSNFESTDSRVIMVADKYDITHYAATYIVRAIELAKVKDASGINDLGLKRKDFKKILDGDELAESKKAALGEKLLMDTDSVDRLLFDMSNDIDYAHSAK